MQTIKRHPKNEALANEVRERLEELRLERKLNYTQFPKAAEVPRSVYNAWRNSGRVPGGFYLRRMAERLGVTTDWLLCVEGAAKFRGQVRERAELEADLAAHVARELVATYSVDVGDIAVDGKRLLQAAVRAGEELAKRDAGRSLRDLLALPLGWLAKQAPTDRDRRRLHGLLSLSGIHVQSERQRKRILGSLHRAADRERRRRMGTV